MNRAADSLEPQNVSARPADPGVEGKFVCPFCGGVSEDPVGPCPRCTMENTPVTRQATKARIGPWYVLQSRNPSAPGMRYSTLLTLVRKGQVTPRSVVRGPTTYQLWKFAARVKGLSREFGLCYSCAREIERDSRICKHCSRPQEPPANPDLLLEVHQPRSGHSPVNAQTPIFKEIPSSTSTSQATLIEGSDVSTDSRPDRPPVPSMPVSPLMPPPAKTPLPAPAAPMPTQSEPTGAPIASSPATSVSSPVEPVATMAVAPVEPPIAAATTSAGPSPGPSPIASAGPSLLPEPAVETTRISPAPAQSSAQAQSSARAQSSAPAQSSGPAPSSAPAHSSIEAQSSTPADRKGDDYPELKISPAAPTGPRMNAGAALANPAAPLAHSDDPPPLEMSSRFTAPDTAAGEAARNRNRPPPMEDPILSAHDLAVAFRLQFDPAQANQPAKPPTPKPSSGAMKTVAAAASFLILGGAVAYYWPSIRPFLQPVDHVTSSQDSPERPGISDSAPPSGATGNGGLMTGSTGAPVSPSDASAAGIAGSASGYPPGATPPTDNLATPATPAMAPPPMATPAVGAGTSNSSTFGQSPIVPGAGQTAQPWNAAAIAGQAAGAATAQLPGVPRASADASASAQPGAVPAGLADQSSQSAAVGPAVPAPVSATVDPTNPDGAPEAQQPVGDLGAPSPPTPPSEIDLQIERARKLYGAALDAEARGDYRSAVLSYEEIEKLPREAWPSDVQIRLGFARQQSR